MFNNILIDSTNADEMRSTVLNQFCTLMQAQTRAYHFKKTIDEVIDTFLIEVQSVINDNSNDEKNTDAFNKIKRLSAQSKQLMSTLQLLRLEEEKCWVQSACYTKKAIINFNDVAQSLSSSIKQLEHYSTHDPVTNLHNRQYFNDILDYELSRSERHQYEFTVFLIDVDDFKFVNDSFGHPCGDAVLLKMAELFHANLRKGDVISRIGGDEFAIILTEINVNAGKTVAEQLRKTIHNFEFDNVHGDYFRCTISIGVIGYPGDAKSIMELMSGVDVALYHAKKKGKNRVYMLNDLQAREACSYAPNKPT